jgi:E3 ubiquitin-protein ligase MUL1
MLLTGTTLTCFGRLEQIPYTSTAPHWLPGTVKFQYKLSPPSSDHTYIITSMSRDELINDLKATTKLLKWCLIVFGSIGLGIGAYMAWKHGHGFVERKRREYRLRQARLKRIAEKRARGGAAAGPGDSTQENSCVVCLTSPREVILLDCGHVCLCMDCLEMLPSRTCPICREGYRSFAPAYIA